MTDEAPPDPLVGQIVDGRWRVMDRIGQGGMGVVYRAERLKLGKLVAIKFLDERALRSKEAVARFEREARAISRMQHPHSVTILDVGVHQRRPYIVMDYLPGKPLAKEMGKPTMTPVRAVRIAKQMLEALRHAHRNGVVHRDLKPDNVMLTETSGTGDFVKILDFGLARIISVEEQSISLPQTVAGTPSYMSPEQARGEKTDHRTDIYSLGVILFGMCTGKKPFRSDEYTELLKMHMNTPPPSPRKVAPDRNISLALEKVILRSLAKNRDDRYYHAEEFIAALDATPEGQKAGREATHKRPRSRALLAAFGLVAAGAGGALIARPYWNEHVVRPAKLAAPTVSGSTSSPAQGGSRPELLPGPPAVAVAAPASATAAALDASLAASPTVAVAAPGEPAAPPAAATENQAPVAADNPAPVAANPAAVGTNVASPSSVGASNAPVAANPAPNTPNGASGSENGEPVAGSTASGGANGAPVAASAKPAGANAAPLVASARPLGANPSSAGTPSGAKDRVTELPAPSAASSPSSSSDARPEAGPTEKRVAALLKAEQLPEAERQLRAEAILSPGAGWVHRDLGEVYARRLWRQDAEKEWAIALKLDATLARDASFGERLCGALGRTWKGAGERLIFGHAGKNAVPAMQACIKNSDDLDKLRAAVRVLERVGPKGSIDRGLVAARTSELTRKH